ncbi:unnamed protein product [Brassica rapa subsp. trilocularis]
MLQYYLSWMSWSFHSHIRSTLSLLSEFWESFTVEKLLPKS